MWIKIPTLNCLHIFTPPATYTIISVYLFISAHVQELKKGNNVPSQLGQEKEEQEIGIHIRDHKGQVSTYFQNQLVNWKFCSRNTRMVFYHICRVKYKLEKF